MSPVIEAPVTVVDICATVDTTSQVSTCCDGSDTESGREWVYHLFNKFITDTNYDVNGEDDYLGADLDHIAYQMKMDPDVSGSDDEGDDQLNGMMWLETYSCVDSLESEISYQSIGADYNSVYNSGEHDGSSGNEMSDWNKKLNVFIGFEYKVCLPFVSYFLRFFAVFARFFLFFRSLSSSLDESDCSLLTSELVLLVVDDAASLSDCCCSSSSDDSNSDIDFASEDCVGDGGGVRWRTLRVIWIGDFERDLALRRGVRSRLFRGLRDRRRARGERLRDLCSHGEPGFIVNVIFCSLSRYPLYSS